MFRGLPAVWEMLMFPTFLSSDALTPRIFVIAVESRSALSVFIHLSDFITFFTTWQRTEPFDVNLQCDVITVVIGESAGMAGLVVAKVMKAFAEFADEWIHPYEDMCWGICRGSKPGRREASVFCVVA
jgi:hypothetical protein